ncbi:hypothetical protein NECAME_14940 [Necator americanus]|uniref:Uncharacterized protein n=1 Tax=Necator americanus TaxID=51031 RepID=W2SMR0_NECAM|nr:hypothetical protein NECAME_14940 [Necator americanus]ETN70151.1 hypothetical protein NECAME_14940 [Necator americanus]
MLVFDHTFSSADVRFGSLIYGVERVTSSRLGQSDDVVLDLLGLHHQIFDGTFRCKRTIENFWLSSQSAELKTTEWEC